METQEKLPREDRVRLLMARELHAFQDKVTELRSRLLYARRRALRKRGVELAFFLAILFCLVFFAAPFIDTAWKDILARSPTRSMIFSILSSVMLVLILGYIFQVRQFQEGGDIEELRSRLILARERLEEARERARDWTDDAETPSPKPERPPTASAEAGRQQTPASESAQTEAEHLEGPRDTAEAGQGDQNIARKE